MRRWTKTSGRVVSSAAAAERWSFRNPRIRSRASGGSCGDSVAATSAETMSSLRRREICTQRARSIERSSTGGRASARTTAPASDGSTSSRSHASTSLTSARWKNAVAPASRCGTARSSSASATACPSLRTERTRIAISSAAAPPRMSRSTSAATACACARSFAARQKRTAPPAGASRRLSIAVGDRPHDGARRRDDPLRAAQRLLEPHRSHAGHLGGEVAEVLRRRGAEAADRLVVVAGGRERRPVAGEEQDEPDRRVLEVLHVVDEQMAVAGGDPRPDVRLVAQQRVGVQDEVAEVERALLGEQPVVGGVDGGELALALGAVVAGGQVGGPAAVLVGGDHRVLEAVDPRDDAGEQRGRVAAEVVQAQRELVDVVEQHREAVGGRDRGDERVEPRLERLVVQQATRRSRARCGPRALRTRARAGPRRRRARVGGGLGAGEHEHLLRAPRRRSVASHAWRCTSVLRLARARRRPRRAAAHCGG